MPEEGYYFINIVDHLPPLMWCERCGDHYNVCDMVMWALAIGRARVNKHNYYIVLL